MTPTKNAVQTPLVIRLAGTLPPAYAGDWLPLPLVLTRTADAPGPVRLRKIACKDRGVQIDTDLFQPDVEVRPGETYRIDLPVRVSHPCVLDLSTFFVQLDVPPELVQFPGQLVEIAPSLTKELLLQVEPLCAYENGTKVQLTWHHKGTTRFQDFAVNFSPAESVIAGKSGLRRRTFCPDDQDQAEVVVRGETLDIVMTASCEAGTVRARQTVKIVPPPPAPQRPRFRFLAPRRLASDLVTVHETKGGAHVPVQGGAFPVHAGTSYDVTIRPQSPRVTALHLRDIPGRVVVRRPEGEGDGRAWTFQVEINVAPHEFFSRPERLDYTVQSKDGPLAGEIHLRVKPPRWKHLSIAAAFGLALTAQGLIAVGRLLLHPDVAFDQALNDFKVARDYPVFMTLTIPTLWLGLRSLDWLLWRIRD